MVESLDLEGSKQEKKQGHIKKKQEKETLTEIEGKPEDLILGELKLRKIYLPYLKAECRPILRSATNVTLPNRLYLLLRISMFYAQSQLQLY